MRKLFFANWKMYVSDADAEALARSYLDIAPNLAVDLAVAPGFTALDRVARLLHGSPVSLAAQDTFWADGGAYTGEVSPRQLALLGARYVLVGHSERRAYFGETNEMVRCKAEAVSAAGMVPVVCVGETKEEREAGTQEDVVRSQVEAVVRGSAITAEKPILFAYEPRWAIGSGEACRPEDLTPMHGLIRSVIEAALGEEALPHVRVLYGGSVDPSNVESFLALPSVDGVLVGGASARHEDARMMLDLLRAR